MNRGKQSIRAFFLCIDDAGNRVVVVCSDYLRRRLVLRKQYPSFHNAIVRPKPLAALICAILSSHALAQAQDAAGAANDTIQFNSRFLGAGSVVDLSRFSSANQLLPGSYITEIFVNGLWATRGDVVLAASPGGAVQPCFNRQLLDSIGINLGALDAEQLRRVLDGEQCLRLADLVPAAHASFDMGELKMELSIPQIALNRSARGYVSPELWDEGVTAGMLGYDFNSYRYANRLDGGRIADTRNYLGLNGGFNFSGWRVRHSGSYSWGSSAGGGYQKALTYAQHDLTDWKSQLTIGEAFTDGELFDSVAFQGVRVATDDRMLPDSQRGFAPVVRGQANSNAKVTVRQNEYLIYETTVAPGPFEITDLYPTGSGGDLKVTVTEADGSEHTFFLPYAGIPQLLRENGNRFSATYGRTRDRSLQNNPMFAQMTWQHGFSNTVTGYTGGIVAEGYLAGLLGTAWNTSYGALALDLTVADTVLPKLGSQLGTSTRLSYSKRLNATETNLTLAAYRYSTGGYLGFNEAIRARDYAWRGMDGDQVARQRNRLQVSLNQRLKDRYGSIFLTGFTQDYWNRSGHNVQFQAGYNNFWRSLNYSISAVRQRNQLNQDETSYNLSISMPLGRIGSSSPMSLSASAGRDGRGGKSLQSTISGSAGEVSEFTYGATASRQTADSGPATSNGSVFAQYRSPYASFSANAGAGSRSEQTGFGVSGAVVAHPGGVTLSQQLNDTIGVIEARDAGGARVISSTGVRLDGRGYAVLPYLSPYHLNTVELSPKGLSLDVELESTSQRVAPRAGAVVMLKYETSKARSAMIGSRKENGEPLPFGASVLDEQGQYLGVVAQDSRIFIRGAQDAGVLIVRWGASDDAQCKISYTLDGASGKDRYATTDGVCN